MIRLVCCSYYFNLIFFNMKINLPQVFYNGSSGCSDFIGIQKDSVTFVCFDCVKYQIQLIDRKSNSPFY